MDCISVLDCCQDEEQQAKKSEHRLNRRKETTEAMKEIFLQKLESVRAEMEGHDRGAKRVADRCRAGATGVKHGLGQEEQGTSCC